MLDQDMLDVDMLVWSSNSSQVSPNIQEKTMLIQHMLDVNMLVWSSNSFSKSRHGRKVMLIQHMLHVDMFSSKNCLPMRLVKCV